MLRISELYCNKSAFLNINEDSLIWNNRKDLKINIFKYLNSDMIILQEVTFMIDIGLNK